MMAQPLPYGMGGAGDPLKHGVLAEVLSRVLAEQGLQPTARSVSFAPASSSS